MSTETHPEDLLDAWRTGRISGEGQARLQAHAQLCVACRLELEVEPGLDEEAVVGSEDWPKMAAMLGAAMLELPGAPAEGSGSTATSGGMSKLLLAGLATAGVAVLALVVTASPEPAPNFVDGPGPAAAIDKPVEDVEDPARPPGQTDPLPSAPEPAPATDGPPPGPRPEPEPVPVRAPEATMGPSAAELLHDANAERRAKRYSRAAKLYERLGRSHRDTEEEVLSRVTYGTMLLDHLGRADEALERFDAYLGERPRGTLAEEALMGKAKALGRLGRPAAEHEAWQLLLSRFPDSVYAELARQRLGTP